MHKLLVACEILINITMCHVMFIMLSVNHKIIINIWIGVCVTAFASLRNRVKRVFILMNSNVDTSCQR